ncbi:unnamed protein product [Brassicogethes aeneus]|uniref:Endothelin-converting enzyme 1 n=1 Tax=Brassicogethes aeneus TaxID=1431903 RepID=A0A9P0FMM3_BRAAE|nr:unnamed protein product [Brassicogethes aeneus]
MDNLGYVQEDNGRVFAISHLEKTTTSICTTDECLRSATNFKYSIDYSVDPCTDFYQFTCGKWSEEHPNHGWYPSFSTFSTIDEKLTIHMMNFFESEKKDDEPQAVVKARNLYKSCMDVGALNNLGLLIVYKYLNVSGLPVIPAFLNKTEDEQQQFKFDWLNVEAGLKKTFAMDVFFGFVVPFKKRASLLIKLKGEKNDDLDDMDNDDDDDDDSDSSEEYDLLVRTTRGLLFNYIVKEISKNNSAPIPENSLLQDGADYINNITDYIKEVTKNYTGDPDSYNIYGKTIFEAQKDLDLALSNYTTKTFPNFYSIYLTYIFKNSGVTLDPNTDLIYFYEREEKFIPIMLAYVLDMPEVVIELYLWWITVYSMIMNTSSEIITYISRQVLPFYGEGEVVRTRSMECTSLVGSYMGMAVSYVLADKSFKDITKPKVERMINDIKTAFEEQVHNAKWMDKKTKKATLDKCQETLSFVGYPDWLFNNGSLDAYYEGVEVLPATYLENMINIIKADTKKINLLRETNHRNWSTDPNTVNAYNSFFDNAINVPMAILNYPMYNLGLEFLNYGSIGSILGHELTHGFDNSGRKHDKYGNYIQWWSNSTINTFEDLTTCFIDQYDNYTLDGVEGHVNGKKTLGENLADNGGVNQAFKAYVNFVRKNGHESKLPGFENYTNYQLFFIAYGSIWCETTSPDDLESQLESDEHSPNSVRVIGTLQNSEDFARIFKCPKGSKMNPDRKKCKIW